MDKLFEIKNGDVIYNNYNLKDLAIKYGTPLKITFLDVIKNRVSTLKSVFDQAIKELNYNGKFIYLNANKANYGLEEISCSFKVSDGLETSSYYDLVFSHDLFKKHPEFKNKYLVCNGYKLTDYLEEIVDIKNEGYNIINIIDSIEEYEYLKTKNIDLKVGLRIHIQSLYPEEEGAVENDRFGLNNQEFEYIINDIKNTKLVLNTIHFHQRGFDYEEDKFSENFEKVFNNYYVKAAKKYNSVINFDMGGGTPLPIDYNFDYNSWAKYVIKLLQNLAKKYGVKEPNLISENGKYSQKDSTVNIYKVVGEKHTDNAPWLFVDGSLLIALPEMYALGEPVLVTQINDLDKKTREVKLGGITCDCDDVFPLDRTKNFEIADTSNDHYIGLIGTGSYQNSMNGKGGVHHCLLPEEKDIIIYTNSEGRVVEEVRHNLQSISDIYKLINFNK